VGSDLSLGNISEQTPGSGIVMAGWRTLFLTGTNTYTGNTLVTNGTLALTGSASISNTPSISISSGTTFDVSGLTSAFTLGAGQTLTGLGATGTFAGSATLAAGAITLNYNGTPTLTVTNGTLTLNNNSLTVTNLGTILNAGSYKLISAASSGSVGAVAGAVGSSTVNVLGAGASGGALTTLKIVGGELYLVVNHPPVANNVSYVRGSVNSWQIPVANLLTNASDVDISDTLTLSSVGTSTNGITLSIAGGYVSYLNANLVNDQFNYTVADGNGGSATGTVTLVAAPFTSGQSATVTVSGSSATVGFAGIPGYKYEVQRSTNLLSWVTIQTTNAPGGGVFSVTDNFSDLGTVPGSAYYRLSWNGN
jgi:autotransporter-associated beta strand protein